MAEEGVGGRLFEVRAALGEGPRKPLALRAFADLLTEVAGGGRRYHASQISGWETGAAQPGLDDVRVIASLDPEQRGPGWLAFGEPVDAATAAPAAPQAPRTPARPDIASGTPGQDRNRVEGPSPHARAKEEGRKRGRRSGA